MTSSEEKLAASRTGRPRLRNVPGSGDPRRDILAATSTLISSQGLQATTMVQIADLAGLQAPSVYYYFDGKRAIMLELALGSNRVPLEAISYLSSLDDVSSASCLWAFIVLDVESIHDLPFDINEVHRFVAQDEESETLYERSRQELSDGLSALVEAGEVEGEFCRLDPKLISSIILANDEGTQNWLGRGRSFAPRDVGETMADMTVRGLLQDIDAAAPAAAQGRRLAREFRASCP